MPPKHDNNGKVRQRPVPQAPRPAQKQVKLPTQIRPAVPIGHQSPVAAPCGLRGTDAAPTGVQTPIVDPGVAILNDALQLAPSGSVPASPFNSFGTAPSCPIPALYVPSYPSHQHVVFPAPTGLYPSAGSPNHPYMYDYAGHVQPMSPVTASNVRPT